MVCVKEGGLEEEMDELMMAGIELPDNLTFIPSNKTKTPHDGGTMYKFAPCFLSVSFFIAVFVPVILLPFSPHLSNT